MIIQQCTQLDFNNKTLWIIIKESKNCEDEKIFPSILGENVDIQKNSKI